MPSQHRKTRRPGPPRGAGFFFILALLWALAPSHAQDRANAPAPAEKPPEKQAAAGDAGASALAVYRRGEATPDGIGKFYMGREIARVMGHLGAAWLERAEREEEERPAKLIELMDLRATDVVADVGAGTGYFTFRIAPHVPEGKVLAVDVQPQMLAMLRRASERRGVKNVEPLRGKPDDPNLPEAVVDVALMVDAYHEFEHPREMMQGLVRGLKPGGRVVLVEYRAEDPDVPIKPLHKMSEAQAVKEMAAVGLKHLRTHADLPRQHVMIFQKPGE